MKWIKIQNILIDFVINNCYFKWKININNKNIIKKNKFLKWNLNEEDIINVGSI